MGRLITTGKMLFNFNGPLSQFTSPVVLPMVVLFGSGTLTGMGSVIVALALIAAWVFQVWVQRPNSLGAQSEPGCSEGNPVEHLRARVDERNVDSLGSRRERSGC